MSKQVNFFLGISLAMIVISFSISSAYATETISTISFSKPVYDVAVDTNGRIIVAESFDNKVTVFDASGNLVLTIPDSAFGTFGNYGIQRVASDSTNRIIVAEVKNDNVYIFDSNGNFVKKFSVPNLGDIATDTNDRIIVTTSIRQIQIFDSNGYPDFTITNSSSIDLAFGSPISVTTDSKDRIIVGDSGSSNPVTGSAIHVFDSNGNFEFSIKEVESIWKNSGEDIFHRHAFIDRPISIATDSQDRIIVADNNIYGHVVHIFDQEGNYESIIKKDQTNYFWTGVLDNFPEVSTLIELFDWGSITGLEIDSNDRVIVSTIGKSVNIITFFQVATNGGGGDSCGYDCIPPSLESLGLNDIPNWLTAKNQTFNIGDKQEMKFRYSDNRGIERIDLVDIGFGLKTKYNSISESEVILEIFTENGFYKSKNLIDPNNLFVENATKVKVEHVNCIAEDCSELEYTVEFRWAEKPFYGFSLMTATDNRGNASYERHPEEIKVIGETLNVQPTELIYNRSTSSMNDGLFINITRTDKVSDMWIDEKGRYWQGFGNDRFEIIPLTLAALIEQSLTNLK